MRKLLASLLIIPILLLSGCAGGKITAEEASAEEAARVLRTEYLAATGCDGSVAVTADYGQRVYQFGLDFSWRRDGESTLTLTAPEELAGLSAHIAQGESRLEFNGVRIETGDLTGDGLTPLELLPSLMEWTQTGYMAQCCFETLGETETLRLTFRDPEDTTGEGVECSQWFHRENHSLLRGEIAVNGAVALSGEFSGFTLQKSAA